VIQIQTIHYIPEHKTHYWMKDGDQKAKRISKSKWFQVYDLPRCEIEVLPPLTKIDILYEKKLEDISKVIQNFA